MRCARILPIGLIAAVICPCSAAAVENAQELAGYCQSLEHSTKGAGREISIPRTREALTCWGYMQAMQDLSVLSDEDGNRIMGACPPEQTSTLQLVQSFVRYAREHRSELPGMRRSLYFEPCERLTHAPLSTETDSRRANTHSRTPFTASDAGSSALEVIPDPTLRTMRG